MTASRDPVFILGITQRSGTNFLSGMLACHPELQTPSVLGEDFLLHDSHRLGDYVDRTYERWKRLPWIENQEELRASLERRLGDALLQFLSSDIDPDRRLLAKTPSVVNLHNFFRFFTKAKLLILVRDGRDTVESAARKWPKAGYRRFMREWGNNARAIRDFMSGEHAEARGSSWELVHYEGLLDDPRASARNLLDFLELDAETFRWDKLEDLPIFGSSQNTDERGRVVSDAPVQHLADFNPRQRWKNWGWRRKRQFKKLAGEGLIQFGYEVDRDW